MDDKQMTGKDEVLSLLIVEDSPEDRELYKRMLSRSSQAFEIFEAETVAAGLKLYQEQKFDCVLLDYQLPDADGIEFIQALRRENANNPIAVIMVTGQGNEQTAVEAMKLGAVDYITKSSILEGFFIQSIVNAVERSRLRQEIRKYQEDLEKSNQALSEFTYTVSHDLKAPLRRIVSYCELLKEEVGDRLGDEGSGYVNRLLANASRLQRFIDDLLAFSRVMHAKEEMAEVDLAHLMHEIMEDLEPLIEENRARIVCGEMPVIYAYPLRLRQLFLNLVTNAIKFRSKKDPVITISSEDKGNQYQFTVSDNGMGIAPQYLESIFSAFQRLHTHDQIEGTGLGLSICRKVVDMHKGKIWVESEVGKGSSFFISLPKNGKPD